MFTSIGSSPLVVHTTGNKIMTYFITTNRFAENHKRLPDLWIDHRFAKKEQAQSFINKGYYITQQGELAELPKLHATEWYVVVGLDPSGALHYRDEVTLTCDTGDDFRITTDRQSVAEEIINHVSKYIREEVGAAGNNLDLVISRKYSIR